MGPSGGSNYCIIHTTTTRKIPPFRFPDPDGPATVNNSGAPPVIVWVYCLLSGIKYQDLLWEVTSVAPHGWTYMILGQHQNYTVVRVCERERLCVFVGVGVCVWVLLCGCVGVGVGVCLCV